MPERETIGNNILCFAKAPREIVRSAPEIAAPDTAEKTLPARLIERVCGGDAEAFNEFYRLFAPLVHGVVLARVRVDDAEDVVQMVFLHAYKNLHALREPDRAGAWLVMIARNLSTDFHRRARQTEELCEDSSCAPHNQSAQTEAKEILAAIRRLPEAYRETLILRLVEGMTGPEIALQTNLTPESVRVNLSRGMKLLREKLGVTK